LLQRILGLLQQLLDGRLHVLGPDGIEARQRAAVQ